MLTICFKKTQSSNHQQFIGQNLFNLNETSFGAGHSSGVGKSMAALQMISSKARKEI